MPLNDQPVISKQDEMNHSQTSELNHLLTHSTTKKLQAFDRAIFYMQNLQILNKYIEENPQFINQALFHVSHAGWLDGVKRLIESGAETQKYEEVHSRANCYVYIKALPVHLACAAGHREVVAFYLARENYSDDSLVEGIRIAINHSYDLILKDLLSILQKQNLLRMLQCYSDFIEQSMRCANEGCLRVLLDMRKFLKNESNGEIRIRLDADSAFNSEEHAKEKVALLIQARVLLMPHYVSSLSCEKVEMILEAKPDFIHAVDKEGLSLLMHTAKPKTRNVDLFLYLIEKGADPCKKVTNESSVYYGKSAIDLIFYPAPIAALASVLLTKGYLPSYNARYIETTVWFMIQHDPLLVTFRYTHELTKLLQAVNSPEKKQGIEELDALAYRVRERKNGVEIADNIEFTIFSVLNFIKKLHSSNGIGQLFKKDIHRQRKIAAAEELLYVACGLRSATLLEQYSEHLKSGVLATYLAQFKKAGLIKIADAIQNQSHCSGKIHEMSDEQSSALEESGSSQITAPSF